MWFKVIFPYTMVYIYLMANLPAENMLDSRVLKICYEVKFYLNVWSQENIIPLLNSAVWTNRKNSLLIWKYSTLFTALKKLQGKGFYNGISCNSLRVQMHFLLEVTLFCLGLALGNCGRAGSWLELLPLTLTLKARTCVSWAEEGDRGSCWGSTALGMRIGKHSRSMLGSRGSACRNQLPF